MSSNDGGSVMTIAQQEAIKRKASYHSVDAIPSRKSRRCIQKVNTSRLRRIKELFWDDDEVYNDNSNTSGDNRDADTNVDYDKVKDVKGKQPQHLEEKNEAKGDITKGRGIDKPSRNLILEPHKIYDHTLLGRLKLKKIHDSPRIFTIDDFLTKKEINHFRDKIKLANQHKLFQKSFVDDADERKGRTSTSNNRARKRRANDVERQSLSSTSPIACLPVDTNEAIINNEGQGKSNSRDDHDGNNKNVVGDNHSQGQGHAPQSSDSCSPLQSQSSSPPQQDKHQPQRTSTFIHFSKLSNARIAAVENRAADLLSLPNHSIEPLQLVRYQKGQFFKNHHDMGVLFEDGSVELPKKGPITAPRRIITILVYLNDFPEECGGATQFPLLDCPKGTSLSDCNDDGEGLSDINTSNDEIRKQKQKQESRLSIQPKKAMAVMWCNVTKDGMPDPRLVHCGQELVGDAIKYAVNIWACED
uniref:Fe2OG dioxygenase domain-containing protein n=1 Tax=Chaetoceros debilis TaxID=122233 RepID=A0A7S3V452_9STRA